MQIVIQTHETFANDKGFPAAEIQILKEDFLGTRPILTFNTDVARLKYVSDCRNFRLWHRTR